MVTWNQAPKEELFDNLQLFCSFDHSRSFAQKDVSNDSTFINNI